MKKPFRYSAGTISVVLLIGLAVVFGREVLRPFSDSDFVEQVDDAFQRHPINQVTKREFPEWYDRYVVAAAHRLRNGATNADITEFAQKQFRAFRHIQAHNALRASYAKLDAILLAEVAVLRQVERSSTAACAEYAIHGQIKNPNLMRISEEPKVAQAFKTRAKNILEAIVDGREQQLEHNKPTAADHRLLAVHLSASGWSDAEIKLVANRARLAAAPSEKACQLVRRFYEAFITLEPSFTRSRVVVSIFGPLLPTWTADATPTSNLNSLS